MGESFKAQKRKYLISAVIKSVVCGISFGLFALGVVLLALKLSEIRLDAVYYVAITVFSALFAGGLAFLILRPTDKKVAKKLDGEYSLDERVQTALAFAGQQGTIIELQRQDAENTLKTLPRQKIKISRLWQYALAFLLAVALAIAAIVIPAKQTVVEGDEINDTPYTVSEYELAVLKELVSDIKKSSLKPQEKGDTADKVEKLIENLKNAKTEIEKNSAVNIAVSDIAAVYTKSNSYIQIAAAMLEKRELHLSQAIISGARAFRTLPFTEYEQAETYYYLRYDTTSSAVAEPIEKFRAQFSVTLEDGFAGACAQTAMSIMNALAAVEVENDGLYTVLESLGKSLQNLSQGDLADDENIQEQVAGIFAPFVISFCDELALQSYSGAMNRFVGNVIKALFGLPVDGPESDGQSSGSSGEGSGGSGGGDTDPDQSGSSGGVGSGEHERAGEDEVYDPFTKQYVKYYEALARYQRIVDELKSSGKLTEQQQNMIDTYYRILSGSYNPNEG